MVEISLTGSPAELGRQRGEKLKYAIWLAVEHYVHYHTHQFTRKQAYAHGRRMAKDMGKRCPALMEEIYATGQGAAIPEEEFLAYAFRCWNALLDHPATLACYNLACRDPKRGPIVAGVLEDSPPFYLLETVHPTGGIPFYGVNWAGMAWASRSMNKAGVTLGQASSFAGTRFSPGTHKFPFDQYARVFYATRWAIQNATCIADAIDIFKSFECASVLILGDSSGKVVILESCGRLHAIRKPDERGVLAGGTFLSPKLIKELIDEGVAHDWEQAVRCHKQYIATLRGAKGKTTMEWMARHLQTEREDGGWCHDGCQAATIACPRTGEFWVSGYRPCVHGFMKHNTRNL